MSTSAAVAIRNNSQAISIKTEADPVTPRVLGDLDREFSYRLRYRVYCLERRFISPADCSDHRETDEFDQHSAHLGAFDPSGQVLGTARLVLPSKLGFPLASHCILSQALPAEVGEVSRVVISRSCARAVAGRSFNRTTSDIAIQLYRALYQSARACGLRYLITAMEPSLERLLHRIHFPFRPIGPVSDYYGSVRPYRLSLDELEAALAAGSPAMAELFRRPIASDLRGTLRRHLPHRLPEVTRPRLAVVAAAPA